MSAPLKETVTLNYHSVAPGFQIGINRVHPALFRNHISIISKTVSEKPNLDISITFDDGYEDIYHYAYPILKEKNIDNVSMFIITDYIGQINTWDYSFYFNRYRHLSVSQIQHLSEMKWEIGSHGESHSAFFEMSDRRLSKELKDSKKKLEDITGQEVVSVAPPFGRIDQRVYDECCNAGYKRIHIHGPSTVNLNDNAEVVERNNVYSIDKNDSIQKKICLSLSEYKKEQLISSLNFLTIFFKKLLR